MLICYHGIAVTALNTFSFQVNWTYINVVKYKHELSKIMNSVP